MTKNKKITKILISILLLIFFIQPVIVSASFSDQLQRIGRNAGYYDRSNPDEESLIVAIGRLINIVLSFLGVIFIVLLIYSGFMWMTAAGNESQVEKAKKIMIRAIIGVIVILISFIATWFVMSKFSTTIDTL